VTYVSLFVQAASAELGLAAAMSGAWAVQRLTASSGWIDAIWTFGVGLVGVALTIGFGAADDAVLWRVVMVVGFAIVWSLRLGSHIVARTFKGGDDPRYRKLLEEWGGAASWRLFIFLQSQAAAGAVLALAIGLAASAPSESPRIQDAIGALVFFVALAGETVADRQIARFKADPANRNRICDVGLWRLSRHPNYFFEWLNWVAFALIAAGADRLGWFPFLAPALMYATLRYASGVPPLEQHMLRSRGDAFRAYQARTPTFFPRLPRK